MILRRTPPPDDERSVKGARLSSLEAEAEQAVREARRTLTEHQRLASYGIVRLRR
jgi:hypothetical protein